MHERNQRKRNTSRFRLPRTVRWEGSLGLKMATLTGGPFKIGFPGTLPDMPGRVPCFDGLLKGEAKRTPTEIELESNTEEYRIQISSTEVRSVPRAISYLNPQAGKGCKRCHAFDWWKCGVDVPKASLIPCALAHLPQKDTPSINLLPVS